MKVYLDFDYNQYLQSDRWQRLKRDALHYSRHACQLCGNQDRELHVHHRTYRNINTDMERTEAEGQNGPN